MDANGLRMANKEWVTWKAGLPVRYKTYHDGELKAEMRTIIRCHGFAYLGITEDCSACQRYNAIVREFRNRGIPFERHTFLSEYDKELEVG